LFLHIVLSRINSARGWSSNENWIFITLLPFLAGIVLAINLEKLIVTNQDYDAQWWKVGLALAGA
jgi:hypothetical protein